MMTRLHDPQAGARCPEHNPEAGFWQYVTASEPARVSVIHTT